MNRIEIKGRAKINLTLDVLGKRVDGFHEVEMVMQAVELFDLIEIREVDHGIRVSTNHPLLTEGQNNIAFQAAKVMVDSFGIKKGVQIYLHKNIPVAAGLAGGSTDAAAVLLGLNKLWRVGLSEEDLMDLGSTLGSDVPFCILGGTALATGRGEKMCRLPNAPEMWLVLVKPPLEVSTAAVYKYFDIKRADQRPNISKMIGAIKEGNIREIKKSMVNVLESVTLERYPVVREIKDFMSRAGVENPLMSGSGPTVFGFADSRREAEQVENQLKARFPDMFVQVTRTWPVGQQDFPGMK